MSICQLRLNMNYEVYIEENDPVILLSDTINEMYQTTDFTKYTKEEIASGLSSIVIADNILYSYATYIRYKFFK